MPPAPTQQTLDDVSTIDVNDGVRPAPQTQRQMATGGIDAPAVHIDAVHTNAAGNPLAPHSLFSSNNVSTSNTPRHHAVFVVADTMSELSTTAPLAADDGGCGVHRVRGDMNTAQAAIASHVAAAAEQRTPLRHTAWLALQCADATLRGVSQVYLVSNPISGVLVLVGLALSTDPMRAVFALLGALCATLGGYAAHSGTHEDVAFGLHGYDGTLVGAAVNTFVADPLRWHVFLLCIVVALLTGFVRRALGVWIGAHGAPAFTLAFNLMTMGLIVAVRSGNVASVALAPATCATASLDDAMTWLMALCTGFGQLIFCDTLVGSLAVIAAVFWSCLRKGAAGVVGTIVGSLAALGIAGVANPCVVGTFRSGLFGYDATAAAIVAAMPVFLHASPPRRVGVVLVAAVLAAVVNAMLRGAMSVPTLTMPFVIAGWVVVLSSPKPAPLALAAPQSRPATAASHMALTLQRVRAAASHGPTGESLLVEEI